MFFNGVALISLSVGLSVCQSQEKPAKDTDWEFQLWTKSVKQENCQEQPDFIMFI